MKSYTTWILCFTAAVCLMFLAYAIHLWPLAALSGVFWLIGLWGYYFTERSNNRKYERLQSLVNRLIKNATKDRLAATGEIEGLQEALAEEKAKKNIRPGSRVNTEELKKIAKKGETA